ncbi:MAG: beta-propeller domain-containing protein [Acidimicrobiia bacterium]|nr:beta-propeller domain-containing protein [Acidimicrobiia bacterium]
MAALAMLFAACDTDSTPGTTLRPESTTTTRPGSTLRAEPWASGAEHLLVRFEHCDPFLDYVIPHALELVGPYGLESPWYGPWWGARSGLDMAFEEVSAALAAPAGDGGFSGTNVQVAGVDEPDMVKTDGERIVALTEGVLVVIDVTGDEPVVESRLHIGNLGIQSIFLSGDTVLMFGSAWGHPVPMPAVESDSDIAPIFQTPTMQVIEVDISGEAEIVRTLTVDGQFVSGRMVGDSIRLVLASGPVGFQWSFPEGSGLKAEREAIERNKEIIRNSTADNWIPYYLVTDAEGDMVDEGILFDCSRAAHPEEFSGLNMLSVVTIDIAAGLDVVDSTGVLANGDTVYASKDNLYVATQNWNAWRWGRQADGAEPEQVTTDIHKFDISGPSRTAYLGSGRISGYLLNQFAMDEHEGRLRVASTSQPVWWGDGGESESMITVLEQRGAKLGQVGFVDGLGKTEQIYSVRFMGDVGYVVTFRQTDPLYTVDLSDPTKPEVVGELKIPGYSAYLHPLGDGLLLGVGQDATDTGRVQGTQISVFDVSDPSDPTRIDKVTLAEGSNSEAEYDHHAFLYWEPTGLVMIPIQQYWWDSEKESAFIGALALEVDSEGDLRELRRVSHPSTDEWDWRGQIRRSVVIGDSVYTISSKGIMKSSLSDLSEQAFTGF